MSESLLVDTTSLLSSARATDAQMLELRQQFDAPPPDAADKAADKGNAQSSQEEYAWGRQVPDKFKNKRPEDVLDAYENLQREHSRQAQEVGTLRNLVDQALDLNKTTDDRRAAPAPVTADELFADPDAAMRRIVKEELAPVRARQSASEMNARDQAFLDSHPTFHADVKDPGFLAFITKSKYRQGLAAKVANKENPDFDAATELWDAWEENRPAPTDNSDTAAKAAAAAQEAAKAATFMSGSSSAAGGADTATKGPTFSRSALVRMRMDHPAEYENAAFQAQVMAAYQSGRITT